MPPHTTATPPTIFDRAEEAVEARPTPSGTLLVEKPVSERTISPGMRTAMKAVAIGMGAALAWDVNSGWPWPFNIELTLAMATAGLVYVLFRDDLFTVSGKPAAYVEAVRTAASVATGKRRDGNALGRVLAGRVNGLGREARAAAYLVARVTRQDGDPATAREALASLRDCAVVATAVRWILLEPTGDATSAQVAADAMAGHKSDVAALRAAVSALSEQEQIVTLLDEAADR